LIDPDLTTLLFRLYDTRKIKSTIVPLTPSLS
jgi:hypothetical protein